MSDSDFFTPILYLIVPSVVLITALIGALRNRRKKRIEQQQLQTPLLSGDTVGHRVDAATREAEAGFTVCPGCAFENFKRFAHCSLCGELLPAASSDAAAAAAVSATAKGTDTQKRKRTSQQIRVRKRKEWVRKVDVDGNMFWYRGCVDGTSSTTAESQFPGYTVRFNTSQPEDGASVNDVEQPGLRTIDASLQMELVPSTETNAAVFPTGKTLESKERMQEVVAFMAQDFPTKYAHFVVSTSSLIVPAEVEHLKLSMHREFMLEESVDHLSCIQETNIRSFMRINFLDETGVDAGGVHREWFLLVNEMLLDPTLQLFICHNKSEQTHYFNPTAAFDIGDEHLTYYFAAGRLLGRALLEGCVWGFHLAMPLIKIMLGIPVTFSDLEYFDPEAYRSMTWLLENDGVESLGLDFSVTEKRGGGEVVTVDLIPDGRNVAVTDANKHQYLERKFRYMLFESVSDPLYMFLKGVYEVIPQDLLMLFDAEELDYLLCGTQEIDVDDWKASTVVSMNLQGTSVLKWFWEVVAEMPNEYRRRLLQFATGSSRVPLSGFAGLTSYDGRLCPFTLKGVSYYSTRYISSHACFNRLDLPLFRTKNELKTVLLATLETELYGFTTA